MTAAELYADFQIENALWKGGEGSQARTRDAYQRYFRQSCAEGNPPDALRRYVKDEQERFFARTIPGVDGHTYWDGSLNTGFVRNDGRGRRPRYWWWEHVNGPIPLRGRLGPGCGEPHCITPDHQVLVTWSEIKRRYSDEQIIGALQVAAQRLGHTPTSLEWESLGLHPTHNPIRLRFGSWANAIAAAGLDPHEPERARVTREQACNSIRAVTAELGHAPTLKEWQRGHRRPVRGTLVHLFGGYRKALITAGVTDTPPPKRDWTPEMVLAAIADVARELGHLPTYAEWEDGQHRPNAKTIRRQFGSWRAAIAALQADAAGVEDA